MSYEPCPGCEGCDIVRERRMDGDTYCRDCGLILKHTEWDRQVKAKTEQQDPPTLPALIDHSYLLQVFITPPDNSGKWAIDHLVPKEAVTESNIGRDGVIRARLHRAVDDLMDGLK